MKELIKKVEQLRDNTIKQQKALESEGWSPMSMTQWSYLEGWINALTNVLLFHYLIKESEEGGE